MNTRFRKALNNNGKPAKVENTVKGGRIAGTPRLDEALVEKLDVLVESLFSLHKRKYSTLSLNEKRLVEMFCKRYYVSEKGGAWKEGGEKFTTLKLGAFAHKFIIFHLKEYFGLPAYNKFHIVEDERMNPDDLYSSPTTKRTEDPLIQALIGFPREYHPIRAFNGMSGLMAVYPTDKQSEVDTYAYKERLSLVPEEAKYVNPLIPGEVVTKLEEPEVIKAPEVVVETTEHPIIDKFLKALSTGVASPVIAAVHDVYARDPEAFIAKFKITPEIPEDILNTLGSTPRDSDAYLSNLEQLV